MSQHDVCESTILRRTILCLARRTAFLSLTAHSSRQQRTTRNLREQINLRLWSSRCLGSLIKVAKSGEKGVYPITTWGARCAAQWRARGKFNIIPPMTQLG